MITLIKDDKTGLLYQTWAVAKPKGVLLCVHGLGAHTGRWESMAAFMQQSQLAVYALELRGFGQTTGLRGHVASFALYYQDMKRLRDIIAERHPGIPVFFTGESLGGLLVFVAASIKPILCDGAICLSPAFKSALRFPWYEYLFIMLKLVFARRSPCRLPLASAVLTRDSVEVEKLDTDPRELRTVTAQFLYGIMVQQYAAKILKKRIAVPVMFLLAGNDRVVDSSAAIELYRTLPVDDKRLVEYTAMRHALSIDSDREQVFEDIAAWVTDHCGERR